MNSDYRRLIEYRTNRKVTDARMLTMQDAKIIAAVYSGDLNSDTPNMYMFVNDMQYNPITLLNEIANMSNAWITDMFNGSINRVDCKMVLDDLDVFHNFVALIHNI